MSPRSPRRLGAAVLCAALVAGSSGGCGLVGLVGSPEQSVAQGSGHTHGSDRQHVSLPVGDGTDSYEVGYTLAAVRLPAVAGEPGELRFRVDTFEGGPQTEFLVDQTKEMHVYVVRDDLSVYRHLHPERSGNGTWSTRLTLPEPGDYRVIAEFIARNQNGNGDHVILGRTVSVGGEDLLLDSAPTTAESVTAARGRTAVEVTIEEEGRVGQDQRLTAVVTDMQGRPVELDAYLGNYAHLTAFHVETGSMVRLHPIGGPEVGSAGSRLSFHTTFEKSGDYRLFVQVRVDGYLHTVPVDTSVS